MLKRIVSLSVLSLLLFSIISYSEVYSAPSDRLVDVLIGFKAKPDENTVRAQGGNVKHNFHPFINVLAARIPENAINSLSKNPNITYIEPDAQAHSMGHTSTIPEYQESWGVDHIEADKVHSYDKGTAVRVCIVDTGIDYNHSELKSNYKGGYDYVNNDNDPMDDNGHGTHVSGTVAAILDNAGVVGVAPEAYLYATKVLDSSGSGYYSWVIAGIKWCADRTQIISMSLGGSSGSSALKDAVDTTYNKGVLLVAAAGNSGNAAGKGDNVSYPARYDSVIAVAATDKSDKRASFSSTGPAVEISAPGVSVKSTYLGGGYATASGTSMATPHVSGSAALVWLGDEKAWTSKGYTNGDGTWTNVEVRTVLDKTAQDLGTAGRDSWYGYGLVRPDIAAVKPTTAPSAPQNLQAASGNQQVNLSWEASASDGGSAITNYRIYRGTASNGETFLTQLGNVLSYTDNGVTNGNTYYYQVAAVNSVGESAKSGEASATPAAPPPPPPTNNPPVANAGADQSVDEGTSVTLNGSGSSDPDGDSLTYLWEQTLGTSVTLSNANTATPSFTAPEVGASGETLTFQLTVKDPGGLSATDTVNVTVNNVNKAPTANNDSATTDKNTPVTISVLANDSDPDGDTLSVTSVTSPQSGSAVINTDGTITYTPNTDFTGSDNFDYTISDGKGGTATAKVTITINDVSPPPPSPMSAGLTTDKSTYRFGEVVTLTVTATSNGTPVSNASVHLEITTANAKLYTLDSITDASGKAVFTFTPKKSDATGTYNANTSVIKSGFESATASTSFTVKK